MTTLKDKAAFVTGAAGVIGKAICEELVKRDVKVCLADCNEIRLKEVADEIRNKYREAKILSCTCDVTSEESFEGAIKNAKTTFGHLDILINNAAIADERIWKKMMDINLGGVIIGTNLGLKHLTDKDGKHAGHIINTSSIASLMSIPFIPGYIATKSAVIAWSRSCGEANMAQMRGIKVNAVCPDYIKESEMGKDVINFSLNPDEFFKNIDKMYGTNDLSARIVAENFIKVLEDDVTGEILIISIKKGAYYLPKTNFYDL